MSDSLWPHGLQHNRLACTSLSLQSLLKLMAVESMMPFKYIILVTPFSSCPQSFPASGSFPMSQLYASGGQSIRASALASVLPMNTQNWLALRLTDLISVLGTLKSLLQHHSPKASFLWHSAFFVVQLSHPHMTTGKSIAFTRWTFVGRMTSLSRFVIAFLPRSKHLFISWLQSPSAVILEPKKIKSIIVSMVSPSICHEVMRLDAMILVSECWALSQLFHSPLLLSSRGYSVPLHLLP